MTDAGMAEREMTLEEYIERLPEAHEARQEYYNLINSIPDAFSGVGLIAKERRRHVEEEGYTAEHDKEHTPNVLAQAGSAYAAAASFGTAFVSARDCGWPWEPEYWKPSDDQRKNLVRAGALVAAALDRLRAG